MSARIRGRAAAPGIAIGPAWVFRRGDGAQPGPAPTPGSGDGERARSADAERPYGSGIPEAAQAAAARLDDLAARLAVEGRDDEAAIIEAQALMATDPALHGAAEMRVASGVPAPTAVREAGAEIAARIEANGDARVAARGTDVRDVAARIARILDGATSEAPTRPSILVADDLPPSILAELPSELVLGVAMEAGSPTAHAAILARGRGIPMVVGATGILATLAGVHGGAAGPAGATGPGEAAAQVEEAWGHVAEPAWIRVDGNAGLVAVARVAEEVAPGGEASVDMRPGERPRSVTPGTRPGDVPPGPCTTSDGHRVRLMANIARAADAERAIALGAEGIGLFRTEALFLGRGVAPTEKAQRDAYRHVMRAFGPGRPVVIRLADIGGDKAVAYVVGPAEANPFLGVRGIRLAWRERALFLAQLRAIGRAADDAEVEAYVLAPMVATLADADLLIALRDEAMAALGDAGVGPAVMHLGAMVEVPSAALLAEELSRRLDFVSIGTNDLTQYTLAADRGSAELAGLQDALHPAVLRLIRIAAKGAAAAGTPVSVCGEVAGDPDGALVLVGLGIDELSIEPGAIGSVRAALAGLDLDSLRDLAEEALRAPDAAAVRALAARLRIRARPRG